MKEIPLTQGFVAIVDDEDFDFLNQFKWCALRNGRTFYALRSFKRNSKSPIIYMHRAMLDAPVGVEVDHIDGDGLNNSRHNIRLCKHLDNARNRKKQKRPNSSKFKGVFWNEPCGKWRAMIGVNGTMLHLGLFSTEDEAALAYNEAALKHFGEFACLNAIEGRC